MSRLHVLLGALGLAFLVLQLTAASPALAQDIEFTWGSPEEIDAGLIDLSTVAGRSVQGIPDGTGELWEVVYSKNGRVCRAARAGGTWGAGEALSPEGVVARNPQVARTSEVLHVVWEDSRTGHPEIWTRRYANGAWTAEECLTEDATRSGAPSLDATGSLAFLAWQDGVGGLARVYLSTWDGTAWSAGELVSLSGTPAFDPSVACWSFESGVAGVAWADARDGQTEIYFRRVYPWSEPELRVTYMSGNCSKPSLHDEICCFDNLVGGEDILFLNDAGGVTTAWSATVITGQVADPWRISTNQTHKASVSGFCFNYNGFDPWFGGALSLELIAWTEGQAAVPKTLFAESAVAFSGYRPPVMLASSVVDGPVVGAVEGTPFAGGLVVWTEQTATGRRLMAAHGRVAGCEEPRPAFAPAFLIAPEGIPSNTVGINNYCTGEPLHPSYQARVFVDTDLDAAITWDEAQPHPDTGFIDPDESGAYVFSIRGGRCVRSGSVYFGVGVGFPWSIQGWWGVRSPDVDGDCVVGEDDRDYVETRLGGGDFCADLDGSGLVDAADLAIVEATLGDACSQITSEVEDRVLAGTMELQVLPNPVRKTAVFRMQRAAAGAVSITLMDAAGRRVRDLGPLPLPAGRSIVTWDRRDDAGRLAGSGVYFIVARSDGQTIRRKLILVE